MISHGASLTVVEGKPRHRFSMVIPEELLGVETHLEHFYVIKRKLISIYEYFPLMKVGPQLVEERYLHRPISAYDVSCGLFCVVFDMSIEVRNCHLWENIIWTHQVDQGGFSVKLCGNRLIIGSSQGGKYYCKIVDLFVSSHNIMTVMMGECA